jgi:GNAT superfamily N-acetyltransferase
METTQPFLEAQIRRATAADIPGIISLQYRAYPVMSGVAVWGEAHLASHQRVFPQGQLVALLEGEVVGHAANFLTSSERALHPHSYREITARGMFTDHDPAGDTMYGAEIMVDPRVRRRGIATRLYETRFRLIHEMGLRYFVSGGRLPGYEDFQDRMSIEDYVRSVVRGERLDRTLTMQLKSGLRVEGILHDYIRDPRSGGYASLLVWENPDLVPEDRDGSFAFARARRFEPQEGAAAP